MTFVVLGAASAERLQRAMAVFEAAGFEPIDDLEHLGDADSVLGVAGGGADLLSAADTRDIRYVLVHDGGSDGEPGGTYERAHHRVEAAQLDELARRLRSRQRPLITCLAFGYKNGPPPDAALLVDARFLDNPYWVPALRERTGRDPAVVEFVMKQPAAGRLLDDLLRMVQDLLPLYHAKGRTRLVVAFGCTGGKHRSVVLAAEMARRLEKLEGIDVEFATREL